MELKALAAKPKLELVTVDTEAVVAAYGEPLEFWMWDRQDIPTYLKLAQLKEDNSAIFNIVKEIVLDSDGNPVLSDGEMLPIEIMIPVLQAAVKRLGNKKPQTYLNECRSRRLVNC
jgi:hypothetical protein